MNDDRTERALRTALREAADQVDTERAPGGSGLTEPATVVRAPASRTPMLVAVALLVLALVVGVAVATDGDNPLVTAASAPAGEVTPDELPAADADLQITMTDDATAEDIAAVHALLAASPDVAAFTTLDRRAVYDELQRAFRCDEQLLDRALRAGLATHFRVVAIDEDAVARIVDAAARLPGVLAVQSLDGEPGAIVIIRPDEGGATGTTIVTSPSLPPTTTLAPDQECDDDTVALPVTPSTVVPVVPAPPPPATSPPAGEPPADPDAARAAVVEMWTRAFSAQTPQDDRLNLHELYHELPAFMEATRDRYFEQFGSRLGVVIHEVTFVNPTRAAVRFNLQFGGSNDIVQVGYAVLVDGEWRIARETTCANMARAGNHCPPPPG